MRTRTTIILTTLAVACGCVSLPEEGDPCDGFDDSVCESGSGPGIWACIDNSFRYIDCTELCEDDGWTGECGFSEDRGNDVCWCGSGSTGGGWGACTSQSTGVCVAMNFDSSSNPSTARSEWLASCADTSDGDVGDFSEGRCSRTDAVAECTSATGSLESSGESVEIEIVWYPRICSLGQDLPATCGSVGGSFSGGC